MKFRILQITAALLATAIGFGAIAPGAALAHERRAVGKYTLVVGFMGEPAIVGQPNGIDLRISDTASGDPIEGAEKTLKAAIAFGGGEAKPFAIKAVFGKKGAYTADLIPTKDGTYVFTFTGTINDTTVNEKFESGPGRFSNVQPVSDFQFPAVTAPAAQPAPAPQAAAAAQAAASSMNVEAQLAEVSAAAAQARTFGIAGSVIGLLGLAAAAFALMTSRGRSAAGGAPAQFGAK